MVKLREKVCSNPLDIQDNVMTLEGGSNIKNYTWDELENTTQCSPYELKQALKEINAFEFNGVWRVLSDELEFEIVQDLVLVCIENKWDLTLIPRSELYLKLVSEFDCQIVEHILSIYTLETESNEKVSRFLILNKEKYFVCVAKSVLKKKSVWELQSFLQSWKDSIFTGDLPNINLLKALFYFVNGSDGDKIAYLPSSQLSFDPKTRLEQLFKVKPKWSASELIPYLLDLKNSDMNGEQILSTYTRSNIGSDGIKLYTSR